MKKYQAVERELMVVERAAWWNPPVRRILKAAPLVVMYLLLNTRAARAACSFNPKPDPTIDGSSDSLRHAIQMANVSGQDCLIQLRSGTYTLTIKNTSGQDNTAAQGDLDITARGHTVTVRGYTNQISIVNGNGIDRVFQVLGGANAVFSNLTIEGGTARDDGTAGTLPGTTTAEGGGLLVQDGAQVTLNQVILRSNFALGANGGNGLPAHTVGGSGGGGQMAAGGGLYLSDGTVNLLSSKVFGNSARGGNGGAGGDATGGGGNGGNGGAGQPGLGGGLFVSAGTLNLSTSVVSGNHASGGGGGNGGNATGISGFGGFAGGGNQGAGGGLYAGSGSVNLSTSTVYNNRAGGGAGGCGGSCNFPGCRGYSGGGGDGAGGGLFVNGGTLSLWRSTDGQNVAAGADAGCPSAPAFTGGGGGSSRGGGMFASGEGVSVINSTFYGNTADRGGSGAGFSSPGNPGDSEGGGLFVEAGSINLAGVTIASNHTEAGGGSRAIRGSSLGGGICQLGSAPQVRSDSTLIGDNSTQGDGPDVSGQISLSFSLISNTAGASITDGGHNLFDVEPVLDPGGLRTIWGGPTQTVALQSPSPAIDHGDNTICRMARPTGLASVDQRGFSRIRHGDLLCDIGAFEFTTLVVLPSYLYFGFEAVSEQTAVQTATVREAAVGGVTLTESIGGANPGDFVQTANSCGTTLRDGYTCSISIAFKPTTTGSRSALLTVSDSPDRTSPYQIQLVGIGQ